MRAKVVGILIALFFTLVIAAQLLAEGISITKPATVTLAAPVITRGAQSASIGTTNIIASAVAGQYRVCWAEQITQAATTSSSILVTIGWNNGAVKASSLGSINGGLYQVTADASNVVGSMLANCITFTSVGAQPITYSATYASSGATPMLYELRITAERLQ